jgi:hypothetical protein
MGVHERSMRGMEGSITGSSKRRWGVIGAPDGRPAKLRYRRSSPRSRPMRARWAICEGSSPGDPSFDGGPGRVDDRSTKARTSMPGRRALRASGSRREARSASSRGPEIEPFKDDRRGLEVLAAYAGRSMLPASTLVAILRGRSSRPRRRWRPPRPRRRRSRLSSRCRRRVRHRPHRPQEGGTVEKKCPAHWPMGRNYCLVRRTLLPFCTAVSRQGNSSQCPGGTPRMTAEAARMTGIRSSWDNPSPCPST